MTLILELSPAEEARLRTVAREKGIRPEELARQLIANLEPEASPPNKLRVSDELRAMGRKALQDHAAGQTEEFPSTIAPSA